MKLELTAEEARELFGRTKRVLDRRGPPVCCGNAEHSHDDADMLLIENRVGKYEYLLSHKGAPFECPICGNIILIKGAGIDITE